MKRRSVGLGLAALAIFAGLFYLYGGHQTPTGQPPLADLGHFPGRSVLIAVIPVFKAAERAFRREKSACFPSRRPLSESRWFKSGRRNQSFFCVNHFRNPATIRICDFHC
jgi:hypothetical protein